MKDKTTPMTAKRQAILARAFAQLRISRKKIDPSILDKIRAIVKGSPEIMKKLGVSEGTKVDEAMPLSQKGSPSHTIESPKNEKYQPRKRDFGDDCEQIDQAKNMEVMAKLMQLSPDNREAIKAVIKKSESK